MLLLVSDSVQIFSIYITDFKVSGQAPLSILLLLLKYYTI